MKLVVIHYHLRPGGVTGVVREALRALLQKTGVIQAIAIVTGSEENAGAVLGAVRECAGDVPCEVDVVPEIGYMSSARLAEHSSEEAPAEASGEEQFRPEGHVSDVDVISGTKRLTERIVRHIKERYAGDNTVWWIHNHHLGKNAAFTRAVARLIEILPTQRVLLEIHDFPECGRYANLRYLARGGNPELYPTGPAVTYVTINSRDRRLLQKAGITSVEYLPDPVHVAASPEGRSAGVAVRLHRAFGTVYPAFDAERPLLLYPVRTIRRKNIFEAALLAGLTESRANLVVTLPGVSAAEKPYSDMVADAFRSGIIAGLWGIGSELDSAGVTFDALQAAATAFVSSSVQEGFGYMFATSVALGKPLVARYLDILPDMEPLFAGHPHTLYNEVVVPARSPSLSDPLPFLRFGYDERLDRLGNAIAPESLDRMRDQIEERVNGRLIEFSYLPPQMQYAYIKDVSEEPSFRDEVRSLNRSLLREIDATIESPVPVPADRVEAHLGGEAFAKTFLRIVNAESAGPPRADSAAISASMLDAFADAAYQRLLYE